MNDLELNQSHLPFWHCEKCSIALVLNVLVYTIGIKFPFLKVFNCLSITNKLQLIKCVWMNKKSIQEMVNYFDVLSRFIKKTLIWEYHVIEVGK